MKSEGVEKTQGRQVELRVFRYVQNWGRAVGDGEKINFGDACKNSAGINMQIQVLSSIFTQN